MFWTDSGLSVSEPEHETSQIRSVWFQFETDAERVLSFDQSNCFCQNLLFRWREFRLLQPVPHLLLEFVLLYQRQNYDSTGIRYPAMLEQHHESLEDR